MKKRLMTAAVLAALVLLACAACAAAETQNRLLIYMVGSDLESENGYASMDLQEMMASFPADGKLEVLVCAGGASQWQGVISPEIPTLYRLTGSGMEAAATYPGGSMMDSDTLAWFLSQAETEMETALLFWNHGGGPLVGFGYDETDQSNRLQAAEIVQALQAYMQGREKLAWIGFDACLMGTLEMAGLLEPYADYLIASEEVEMGCGWDYAFLSHMTEGLSTPRLASHILSGFFDTTVAACGGDPQMMPAITLACYDLSRYHRLADRFDELARQMDASVAFGSFAALAHSRSSVPTMGRFSGGLNTELVDLRRLVQSVQAYYPEEVQAVMDVLDEMVVACVSNHPDNSGISVYFPYNDKAEYLSGMDELYRSLMPVEGYRAFVDRFAKQWVEGTLEHTQLLQQVDSEQPSILLSNELLGSYADAYYVIAQDFGSNGYGFYYMGSETELFGNVLTAHYPMETAYLVSGKERFPIYLTKQEEDTRRTLYHASVFLVRTPENSMVPEMQSVELQISMNRENRHCTVVGAYLEENGMMLGKRQVDLAEWETLQTVFYGYQPTYSTEGTLLPFSKWYATGSVFGMEIDLNQPFGIEMAPIENPEGNLYCQFVIRDIYGNLHGSELVLLKQGTERRSRALVREKQRLTWEDTNLPLIVADTEQIYLELTEINRNTGAAFEMQAYNKTEQGIYLSLDYIAINGVTIHNSSLLYLQPDENFQWKVDVSDYPFEAAATDIFTSVQLYLTLKDDGFSLLGDPIHAEIALEWPIFSHRPLYDRATTRMKPMLLWRDEEVSISATNVAMIRSSNGKTEVCFELQNNTDAVLLFKLADGYLNDWMLTEYPATIALLPGTKAFAVLALDENIVLHPTADNRLGVIWNWQSSLSNMAQVHTTGLQEIPVEAEEKLTYTVLSQPSPWGELNTMDFRKTIGNDTVECTMVFSNSWNHQLVLSTDEIIVNGDPCRCAVRMSVLPQKRVRTAFELELDENILNMPGTQIECTLEVYDAQQQTYLGQLHVRCEAE